MLTGSLDEAQRKVRACQHSRCLNCAAAGGKVHIVIQPPFGYTMPVLDFKPTSFCLLKVEAYFYDTRRQLFEYDQVLNTQRDKVSELREGLLCLP